jgi:hypothetical protein
MKSAKLDNNPNAKHAKIELREHVLAHVKPARVFDVFCGLDGMMHRAVWHKADSYVGCDQHWQMSDPRRRFVGDSLRILRCVDLSPWNVFDVDAYGDPWPALYVLLHRRVWRPGELGALCITDGSTLITLFGVGSPAMAALTGVGTKFAPTHTAAAAIGRIALQNWLERQQLTLLHLWETTIPADRSSNKMRYSAVVFQASGEP